MSEIPLKDGVARTPDGRFADLPGYPFAPNYVAVDGMRMHYVDEGEGPVVLMLHGEPSWSYLYRKMIPLFARAGYRAIAPDLLGFGKSDKPTRVDAYSYAGHVAWMKSFIEALELGNITLICQDWGALIGLRLAAENQHRFSRILLANGALPTGRGKTPLPFRLWQLFARRSPWFPIGRVVDFACVSSLPAEVRRAYDAPFPDERHMAGTRAFPPLVPSSPKDPAAQPNQAAWEVLRRWEKPFLTLFGDSDPIMRGAEKKFQREVPGARDQPHGILESAGHFIQEDQGEVIAERCVQWMEGR